MSTQWQDDERWLWNQFTQPVTPKVSLHGLNPEERKKALLEIEKQKQKAFSDQWKYFHLFINH